MQVGQHRVIIDRYLSEGGFAHVYVVRIPRDGSKTGDVAVLKRVAVPDKDNLTSMRTEVETMKKLKGHKHIVTYIDSHASQLKGGGYEVFLLMEFCSGGGLIDFMNTRLQHRLTEPEILHIFADVAEGVAAMHYLKPTLLHRDLKVENVLISTSGSSKKYKLCDFGSAAQPRPAATTAAEGRLIEEDVQKHTTMQYRSPEMIDVYRKQPINEKSDIWALGVLLYKLCYYTTPFEEQGQNAILHASFKYPSYPSFSDRLKRLIASMLKENPALRPNIYQVITEVCSIRGTSIPIKDVSLPSDAKLLDLTLYQIYSQRTQSESRRYEKLPPLPSEASLPIVGLSKVAPVQTQSVAIPDITPMRRGRPKHTSQAEPASNSSKPSNDPFAALDSKNFDARVAAVDELAQRYPSVDEFSILHDQGQPYQFKPATKAATISDPNLKKRVTEVLADNAFAKPTITKSGPASGSSTSPPKVNPRLEKVQSQPPRSHPPTSDPRSTKSSMISTGVQTSPLPSPSLKAMDLSNRPIWRVPNSSRSPSRNQLGSPDSIQSELPPRPEPNNSRKGFLEKARTHSQTILSLPKSSVSSRPSLEGSRPSAEQLEPIEKTRSASAHRRPESVFVESNLDFLRDQEASRPHVFSATTPKLDLSRPTSSRRGDSSDDEGPDDFITSDVDFLHSIETSKDTSKKRDSRRRSSSGGKKRTSIPTISLTNTKNILAGKFGDAFRRFETNSSPSDSHRVSEHEALNPNGPLSPIMGSEATGTSGDDDRDNTILEDDSQSLSPEVRRELERRRLSQEEKRVAAAAAEYRQRLERGDKTTSVKASFIQNRVKSLLHDSKTVPVQRTAEGYGKYTDTDTLSPTTATPQVVSKAPKPIVARKPVAYSPVKSSFDRNVPRIAPKPLALRTGGSGNNSIPVGSKEDEDWETNFAKRYPSLSGIEMVETEIGKGRVRDV